MGEAADMVLDGILDWDGDYTGNEHGGGYKNNERLYRVLGLLRNYGIKKDRRYPVIMEYAALIGQPTASQTAKYICSGEDRTNWNIFKKWVANNTKNKFNALKKS